mmetsp:Transcript_59374/g.170595  ORF Transcript_59374/g.170595 Transcript_59374/m.170595 type:complete len:238 (-) Transcript_59374:2357-3070(-)
MSKYQRLLDSDHFRMSPTLSAWKMSTAVTSVLIARSSRRDRHSFMVGADSAYLIAQPEFDAKERSCVASGTCFFSATNRQKDTCAALPLAKPASVRGSVGGVVSVNRKSWRSSAGTSSASSSTDSLPSVRRLRSKSLFLSKARSIVLRQFASLHSKPSLTMEWFRSINVPMASSTGLPKNPPTCLCGETRSCSRMLPALPANAIAISRTAYESRLLQDTSNTCKVLLYRRDAASSTP